MSKTDKDCITKVHEARSSVVHTFQEKWTQAQENARFYRLEQYSDTQLQSLTAKNRVPYVLDYVSSAMNTFLGVQRDQRSDIAYLPVESGDEMRVEVSNAVKDSVLRNNNFTYLESEVFQDGLIEKMGCLGYDWSFENNPLGELKMYRIPPRQLTWDLNRRSYSIGDSAWASRQRLMGKREMAKKFPDFAKEIEKMALSADFFDELGLDESYLREILDNDLGAAAYIEFYEKSYDSRFFIINPQDGSISDQWFKTKKEAEAEIAETLQKFEQMMSMSGAPSMSIPPPPPEFVVHRYECPIVIKSEICQEIVLTNEETQDAPFIPYDSYYPFWHDGEWWGVMDTLKDPQRFINKTFLMIDHQMSTGSKGLLMIDESVPEVEAQKIINGWSTTGGAFRVKDPKNNITFIPPTGFDPRLIGAMDVAIVNLEKKAGGSNFLGHQETASESGVAVKTRIAQGGLASFVVYDNLSRWKKSVGEKVLWYISNFMTTAQKVRLQGKDLTATAQEKFPDWYEPSSKNSFGFLTINTTKENSLTGLKADVIVDEAKHSVTKNQATLQTLAVMMQSSPMVSETISSEDIVELLDIPATQKEKMKENAAKNAEMRAAQQQAEAQKPPSVSASLADILKLDPEAQAQMMQKYFGIQITEPMNDKKLEIDEQKAVLDSMHKDSEREFKKKKHDDQMTAKAMQLLSQREIEHERIEAQKEKPSGQETGS